jgi:hypothetical protein
MTDAAGFPRLFIAAEALQSPAGVLADLNTKLHEVSADLPSLRGRRYEECLSQIGPNLLTEVIRLLEESNSGWFVRGVWGEPHGSGPAAMLDRSIFSFHLSLRSVHCLSGAGLRTIRHVVARTEDQLLHIKNLGRKSLNEIKELLVNSGLELGQAVEPAAQEPRQPWWDVNLYYLLPVDSLQLTEPIIHGLKKRGIQYIGDLATRSEFACAALPGLDRALLAVNMGFGEQIPEWQRQRFSQLCEFFRLELQTHLTATGAKPPKNLSRTRSQTLRPLKRNCGYWPVGRARSRAHERGCGISVGTGKAVRLSSRLPPKSA